VGLRVYLKPLPPEHELRNKPLKGSFYHATNGKFSREVFSSYGIANKTYNDLGPAWTDNEEFYFEIVDEIHRSHY
jgi:hypothetical protein